MSSNKRWCLTCLVLMMKYFYVETYENHKMCSCKYFGSPINTNIIMSKVIYSSYQTKMSDIRFTEDVSSR